MESTTDKRPRRLRSETEGYHCGVGKSSCRFLSITMLKFSSERIIATLFEIVTQAIDDRQANRHAVLARTQQPANGRKTSIARPSRLARRFNAPRALKAVRFLSTSDNV